MPFARVAALSAAIFAVACGGQVLGGDAGTGTGDGSPPPTPTNPPPPALDAGPPTPVCTPMSGGGTVGTNGDCSVSEDWSCGQTKYTVDCTCSSTGTAQCSCSAFTANGGMGTMLTYNGCPSCSITGSQLAQLCGFPY